MLEKKKLHSVFMSVAIEMSKASSCYTRQVGAVIVSNGFIVATGYNGTPKGMKNCNDGGCVRCNSNVPSGTDLEKCWCLHAEMNAILTAVRIGAKVAGSVMFVTTQPCLRCALHMIQAGITAAVFLESYGFAYPPEILSRITILPYKAD